jgi:hypothetical protein
MEDEYESSRAAMIQFINPPPGERFAVLQQDVDRRFPAGRFVAVEAGNIVADAESHSKLVEKLRSQGKSPKGLVVIQAGVHYPAAAVIFSAFAGRQDA